MFINAYDSAKGQTWTGHCAIVPWHRGAPFDEHRRLLRKKNENRKFPK